MFRDCLHITVCYDICYHVSDNSQTKLFFRNYHLSTKFVEYGSNWRTAKSWNSQ